jgi:anaerobic sulfite reductase subunit B
MLYAFGVGEVPISVSGASTPLDPLRCTVRAVGSVTDTLCATAPGGLLGLRGRRTAAGGRCPRRSVLTW